MQTFLPYADLRASCVVLDDRRLGKQRVETFQILRALTWPTYAWKSHPAVRMWRGFTPGLVLYGVESCREWTRRGYADSVLPQLLEWSGGEVPVDPALPPWFGVAQLHRSHRSALLRKDPVHYRPLFGDEPDDLPYFWPPAAFPQWPLRPSLGLDPWPWQRAAVDAVQQGRDVLLVCRPGAGGSTTGLLAGLAVPGTSALVAPPLGPPDGPVPAVVPPPQRDVSTAGGAEAVARRPGPEDRAAMAAEAEPSAWVTATSVPPGDLGLVVLDRAAPSPRPTGGPPVLCVVDRADPQERAELIARHGLRQPVHLGAGWDPAGTHLGVSTRAGLPAEIRSGSPALVVVAGRSHADRVLVALRSGGLRATTWAPQMRASRAAQAIAAWRSRKVDALVVPLGELPPLGRIRPRLLVHVAVPTERDSWRDVVASLAPDRATVVQAEGWSAGWVAQPGCLRASLLDAYGEPVAVPCGRCDRCVP